MSQNPQMTGNRPRMRRQRYKSTLIIRKHIIEKLRRPLIMFLPRLSVIRFPQFVLLRKAILSPPLWKLLVNIRLGTPPIAGMFAQHFPQELLDQRIEGGFGREFETGVREIRRLETSIHRTDIVVLRRRHLSPRELFTNKCMGCQSLLFADTCQMGVGPEELPVAVEFRPVVIPGLGPVFGFCDVVVTFSMSAEVEEFV